MLDYAAQLDTILPAALEGSVLRITGLTAAVADLPAPVGAVVEIERQGGEPLEAEVIGFRDEVTLVYPFSDLAGVRRGNRVRLVRTDELAARGRRLARTRDRRPRPLRRRSASAGAAVSHAARSPAAGPCDRPRIDSHAVDRRSRDRRPADLRQGAADGHLRRLGRRQERDAGHDGAIHVGRRQRDRPDRRTRPRSQRVHRTRPGARGAGPERRRCGDQRRAGPDPGPAPPTPPRPSPNTFATRARTCCW